MTATVRSANLLPNRVPAAGKIVYTVNTEKQVIRDPAGNVVFQGPLTLKIVDGETEVELPASDDATLEPSGFTFTATEQLDHVSKSSYRRVEFQTVDGQVRYLADYADGDEIALDPSYGASLNGALGQIEALRDGTDPAFTAALAASTVAKWKPSTAYVAGDKVMNPDGLIVQARIDFTSGATYSQTNWMLAPTSQTSVPIARQAGDGRTASLWEFIHNGTGGVGGYIYHWLVGAASGAGDWVVGLGVDAGLGNGIIIRNKAKGIGLKIEMLDTISSATAFGLAVEQKSTVAPAVSMTQTSAGTAPLMESFSFVNDPTDTAVLQRWVARAKPAGEVRSDSGKLVWQQNIEVVGTAVDVRDYNTVAAGDRYRLKHNPRNLTWHSLSATGSWNGFRLAAAGSQWQFGVAAASADPDAATYTNLMVMRAPNGGEIGFHGVTPVARQAVAAAATDAATTMTLVNDLRAKLVAKGLVS